MKTVTCKSGIKGWQCRLQDNYDSYLQWEDYSNLRNLHQRLGYKTPKTAWQRNPIVQGSVNPSDFRKCSVKKK